VLQLHTYFRSSASYRVRIALALKGLTYTSIPVHLLRHGGEQHLPEFASLNPAELIPVLVDGSATLTQSLPIIEYLEEVYPLPALLPADTVGRARVRAIAQTIACEIHPLNNLRVLQYLERTLGSDAQARKTWYAHWVNLGFSALEAMLSDNSSTGVFCHGDAPTLADCCLVPQIYNAKRYEISLSSYPTIRRIGDTCLTLDAFQLAAPSAQPDAS
jgi:maleylacetoacetate isomerase